MVRSMVWIALAGCSEYDLGAGAGDENLGLNCDGDPIAEIDVPLNDTCGIEQQTGTFTPVVEWSLPGNSAFGPPTVGQLNDDNDDGTIDALDIPDIVYQTLYGELVSVNGMTGQLQWSVYTGGNGYQATAIGDLDGDGVPEIVAPPTAYTMATFDNEGQLLWQAAFSFGSSGSADHVYPSIADMDGDGFAEVIAGSSIYSHDGELLGVGSYGAGSAGGGTYPEYRYGALSVPVDLDGDGELEVVVGNAAYNKDGSTKYYNGSVDGIPAVADFDGDGEPEIVVVSGAQVWTLESDMEATGWSMNWPVSVNYFGPPAADDMDGDGIPEFVVAGGTEMIAFKWNGEQLWSATIADYSGAAGPSMFDFEGDGYPEVVYADEGTVRIFDGKDGAVKMTSYDHGSGTLFECPTIADVDNDGQAEILVNHNYLESGLSVYGDADESWRPARGVWNQHAYSITNINDDMSVPTAQTPNWEQFNNFRSADAGLPPDQWNDVSVEVLDVCADDCPGSLAVVVRVLNAGTEATPPGLGVSVRAGADGPVVATVVVEDPIPSGRSSTGLTIEVDPASLDGAGPVVEVDRGEGASELLFGECDEENNQDNFDGCP